MQKLLSNYSFLIKIFNLISDIHYQKHIVDNEQTLFELNLEFLGRVGGGSWILRHLVQILRSCTLWVFQNPGFITVSEAMVYILYIEVFQ